MSNKQKNIYMGDLDFLYNFNLAEAIEEMAHITSIENLIRLEEA